MGKTAKDLQFERILDVEALRASANAIAQDAQDPASMDARNALFAALKEAIGNGREVIAGLLREDGSGLDCARRLSWLQDNIINTLYNYATEHAYPVVNPSTSEYIALSAVGGYGRQTLAPGSDIDLLILLPYKPTPWTEQVVEYVLYMLWDMGFKVGHATRNLDECIRLSNSDLTIRTSILDARFLCGSEELFDKLEKRFDNDVVRNSAREFIAAKLAERDVRHQKAR